MRLTKKFILAENGYYYYSTQYNEYTSPLVEKLGQLEDIEEELGIDLITLFKALEEGIWFKNFDGKLRFSPLMCAELEISEKGLSLISMEMDALFYFKDYGKTWALTREELL